MATKRKNRKPEYRIQLVARSSITGKFVRPAVLKKRPRTTQVDRVKIKR